MNLRIAFLYFFLSGTLVFAQKLDKKESNRIYWKESLDLNWSDFQGEPEKNRSTAASSSIAIPYGFKANSKGEVKGQLRVYFEKDKSWSKEQKQSNRLLAHEQLHFDIAELNRRKLVKALKEAKLDETNFKEKLENIVLEHWNGIYREMQDQYDRETDFSKNAAKQEEWRIKINRLLNRYSRYSEEEFLVDY
jgi:hypothetical protein